MECFPEGNAIIYCDKAFNTTNGKTAHGLVRRTERYNILSVIDSSLAGMDAGEILNNKPCGIPVLPDLNSALDDAAERGIGPTHFVIGIAPEGGRLDSETKEAVKEAIKHGLNVDCALHDLLSEDEEIRSLADDNHIILRDIRKTPERKDLHFFSGKIEQVDSLKIAVLGTDSAVGKRTTCWILIDALKKAGITAEMTGTGQTAWMQGAEYSIMLDSLINDFVSGEIEHAVWSAWNETRADVIIIEGQGSLMNPAFPGGFEILAAARPDMIILQHAPARKFYDGFPGCPFHPVSSQISAIQLISGKPVAALTINHENIPLVELDRVCSRLQSETGIPAFDVCINGADEIVSIIKMRLRPAKNT